MREHHPHVKKRMTILEPMAKKSSTKLKVTKVEFVPVPDSNRRLKRIMDLLLREPNCIKDGACEDEHHLPK